MSFREFLKLAVAALLIALAAALHSPYAEFAASPSAGWASTSPKGSSPGLRRPP